MKKLFLTLILSLFLVTNAFAAASVTFKFIGDINKSYILQYVCTAHTDGACAVAASAMVTSTSSGDGHKATDNYVGRIEAIRIKSGASLSAGSIKAYKTSDTNNKVDLLSNLGGTILTTANDLVDDTPFTTQGFLHRLQNDNIKILGAGMGSGGILTLEIVVTK